MRMLTRVGLLVALWLLAWGQITLGNVVSGAAVATALLLAFPPARPDRGRHVRMDPAGALRLAGYVLAQLVTSNVVMTREILRPRSNIRPGVLAHRLRAPSEQVVTVMTSVIALSPGTMTADVDAGSTTISVHFLFLHDEQAARASLDRLERLVSQAVRTRQERL